MNMALVHASSQSNSTVADEKCLLARQQDSTIDELGGGTHAREHATSMTYSNTLLLQRMRMTRFLM